jgi:hypothetical protein
MKIFPQPIFDHAFKHTDIYELHTSRIMVLHLYHYLLPSHQKRFRTKHNSKRNFIFKFQEFSQGHLGIFVIKFNSIKVP